MSRSVDGNSYLMDPGDRASTEVRCRSTDSRTTSLGNQGVTTNNHGPRIPLALLLIQKNLQSLFLPRRALRFHIILLVTDATFWFFLAILSFILYASASVTRDQACLRMGADCSLSP